MRFPQATSRLPLLLALFATLFSLKLPAQARDRDATNSGSSNSKRERLVATPVTLEFGRVAIGRRKFQTVTITNSGNSDIRLLQVITRGRDFTVFGLNLPVTLARGESYTFNGVFAPRSKGASRANISFVSEASDISNPAMNMELTGMGADDYEHLTINPATMNFGAVQLGLSASQTGTLTAGANAVTISSAVLSSPEFALGGMPIPVTIPPGASQGFTVTFAPQATGTVSAGLSFLDVNANPLAVETLNGTGINPQDPSVNLSWNASNSQNVIGYNIYRGNQSGGPYTKINSALDPDTAYTDTTVTDGNTYYYVTTAVNSDYEESVYSNQAQATVP
jgi:hypothetical protein